MNLIQLIMTPNVVINNILTCLFAFVEVFLYLKIMTSISKKELNFTQTIIYLLSTGLIAILSNFLLKNPYSYLTNIFSWFIIVLFLFKRDIKSCIISLILSYASIFISTFTIQIFLNVIFNISYNTLINIPLYRFLACNLIYFMVYLIYLLINNRFKIVTFIKPSLKVTICINLILGIVTMFIQSYIFSTEKDNFPVSTKLITLLSLLLYFIISMFSLIRTSKLEQTTQDLETEKVYNKTLTLLHDNIRCFKHDFNNIVQAIGWYVALKDIDGLEKYYNSLLKECKLTNNLNLLNPETINNPSIYSLLTNKYYLASEKGITMTFNIFTDLSKINCSIYELTRILGILLDNAIEAAEETSEKIIEIDFRTDSKKQLFIIENSCINNNISTIKIFEKGYSTKENNSGIGLWKVHKILSKNTNLDLFTTIHDNKFRQQLEVFY